MKSILCTSGLPFWFVLYIGDPVKRFVYNAPGWYCTRVDCVRMVGSRAHTADLRPVRPSHQGAHMHFFVERLIGLLEKVGLLVLGPSSTLHNKVLPRLSIYLLTHACVCGCTCTVEWSKEGKAMHEYQSTCTCLHILIKQCRQTPSFVLRKMLCT